MVKGEELDGPLRAGGAPSACAACPRGAMPAQTANPQAQSRTCNAAMRTGSSRASTALSSSACTAAAVSLVQPRNAVLSALTASCAVARTPAGSSASAEKNLHRAARADNGDVALVRLRWWHAKRCVRAPAGNVSAPLKRMRLPLRKLAHRLVGEAAQHEADRVLALSAGCAACMGRGCRARWPAATLACGHATSSRWSSRLRQPSRMALAAGARCALSACLKTHTANSMPCCLSFGVVDAPYRHVVTVCVASSVAQSADHLTRHTPWRPAALLTSSVCGKWFAAATLLQNRLNRRARTAALAGVRRASSARASSSDVPWKREKRRSISAGWGGKRVGPGGGGRQPTGLQHCARSRSRMAHLHPQGSLVDVPSRRHTASSAAPHRAWTPGAGAQSQQAH